MKIIIYIITSIVAVALASSDASDDLCYNFKLWWLVSAEQRRLHNVSR